jgi:hypothetical protein
MSFPAIGSSNNNGTPANTTAPSMNLPSGIVAGNLLLGIICGPVGSYTWPAGWTEILDASALSAAYRIADGSEGASITITNTNSAPHAMFCYRITGTDGSRAPAAAGGTAGSTATPDPPSLTPPWGSADNLWFAVVRRNSAAAPTGFPTNYTLSQINQADGGSTLEGSVGVRQLTASSDDPGTFAFAASATSMTATIAVKGASSLVFNPNPMLPFLVR